MNDLPHRPRYDGVTVFLPDVSLLRRGDILLTANNESSARKGIKLSKTIRAATKGRFSHALICTSPPTFVEAVQEGVGTISLSRCFVHDLANVRILRYPDAKMAAQAAAFAQLEIGRDYSTNRAIGSVLPGRLFKRDRDRGTFCSALVAHVYIKAGSEIFARTSPDRTTPATIDALGELDDITNQLFRPALAPSNVEIMCALDGDFAPSLSSPQTAISRKYALAVRPLAEHVVRAFPEVELEPSNSLWGTLQFIMDAIERVAQVPEERQDSYVDAVKELDEALAADIASGELERLFAAIAAHDDVTLEESVAQSFLAEPDIDVASMRGLYIASNEEIPRRRAAIGALEEFEALSDAIRVYLPIDRKNLATHERRNRVLAQILTRIGSGAVLGVVR
jgi:hypothetical protein